MVLVFSYGPTARKLYTLPVELLYTHKQAQKENLL